MIRKTVAASVVFLHAALPAWSDVHGEIDLEIVIGRTEVMHDQTARGLTVLGVHQARGDGELLGERARHDQYARIADAVVRYNSLRALACGARVIQHRLCYGAHFAPPWYARGRAHVRPHDLRRMAEEMQRQTVPLWTAVCDRARQRSGDRDFCAIE
jgi:hypothetical protein